MSDSAISEQAIQIEHVTIRSTKAFAEVKTNFERLVPKLGEDIAQSIASGEVEALKQKLDQGPELAIFLCRDHGSLLKIAGRASKASQYEIGNPLTASKMTRHRLAAALYAPLRVVLYEDEGAGCVFEYDKPSSLFGQFSDNRISEVARGLDTALQRNLQRAME